MREISPGCSSELGREQNREGNPKSVDGMCRQPGDAPVVLLPQRPLMQQLLLPQRPLMQQLLLPQRPLMQQQVTLSLARDGQQVGHICVIRDYYY